MFFRSRSTRAAKSTPGSWNWLISLVKSKNVSPAVPCSVDLLSLNTAPCSVGLLFLNTVTRSVGLVPLKSVTCSVGLLSLDTVLCFVRLLSLDTLAFFVRLLPLDRMLPLFGLGRASSRLGRTHPPMRPIQRPYV